MGRVAGEGGMPQMIILVVAPTKPRRSVNPDFDISYLRRRSEHNISRGERREAKMEPAKRERGDESSSGALITSLRRSPTRIEGIIFRGLTY